jgi:imidazolonepropionase-like amidohydrolase
VKAIFCGKLIDGIEESIRENAVILIEDSKILEIGDESEIDTPRMAEMIDFSDQTVLPGLIDTHLHLALAPGETYIKQFSWPDSVQLASGIVNSRQTLDSGVTTARDLGARDRIALDLRWVAEMGMIMAPRLLVCGRSITMTGGHFHYCNAEADGVERVRNMVRELLKENVDFIKIMTSGGGTIRTRRDLPSYTLEEVKAAVDEVRRQDKTITAHCHASAAIENCVEAGVNIIEHASFLEPGEDGIRHEFREDLANKMKGKGIYADNVLNPTQSNPERLRWSYENFRKFDEIGVKILPGTDGLRPFQTANMAFSLEMRVRAGKTPMEAIKSATKLSSEALGLDGMIGTIEAGKEADIIAVKNDPLQDITSLRNVTQVIKGGEMIPKSGREEAIRENKRLADKIRPILDDLGYKL